MDFNAKLGAGRIGVKPVLQVGVSLPLFLLSFSSLPFSPSRRIASRLLCPELPHRWSSALPQAVAQAVCPPPLARERVVRLEQAGLQRPACSIISRRGLPAKLRWRGMPWMCARPAVERSLFGFGN